MRRRLGNFANKTVIAIVTSVAILSLSSHVVLADEELSESASEELMDYTEDYSSEEEKDYIEAFGAIPIDIDVPFIEEGEIIQDESSIPSAYDLRDYGYSTSVKNQGSYNTCWTFASLASAESTLMKSGYDLSPDLSERHLAYYALNYDGLNDPLGNTEGDYGQIKSGKNLYNQGGNIVWSSWALAGWRGAADEAKYPYQISKAPAPMDELPIKTDSAYDAVAHVQNTRLLNFEQPNAVKSAIMQYGGAAADYYHSSTFLSGGNYFCNTSNKVNHSVIIIGWDDNYPKENFKLHPLYDGAWLVKNSWGTSFGDKGYMWLSYEDVNLKYGIILISEGENNYDNNYFYDGSIWGTMAEGEEFASGDNCKYANVFTVPSDGEDTLAAVSVAFASADVDYSVQVYLNPEEGNPSSGTALLASPVTGRTSYAGMYTINLPDPVLLSPDDDFAIVVSVPKGTKMYYARNYSYSEMDHYEQQNEGQSFFGSESDSVFKWTDAITKNVTFRIHAYTDDGNLVDKTDISVGGSVEFTEGISSFVYSGKEINPEVTVKYGTTTLVKGLDYFVTYAAKEDELTGSATMPKEYTATITGIKRYTGTLSIDYSVLPYEISDENTDITLSTTSMKYTGDENKPSVSSVKLLRDGKTISLVKNVDYTISYKNNINARTRSDENAPTVVITGIGGYAGEVVHTFSISPREMSSVTVSGINASGYGYTGGKVTPKPVYTYDSYILKEGTDYDLSYQMNVQITDSAKVRAIGKGNFTGTLSNDFSIVRSDISNSNKDIVVSYKTGSSEYEYTGSKIEPELVITNQGVTLKKGIDYSVSFINNIDVGGAQPVCTIKGINNYYGERRMYFSIVSADISALTLTLEKYSYEYTGNGIEPKAILKDAKGNIVPMQHYVVEYENNRSVASADSAYPPTVYVRGRGIGYEGEKSICFNITQRDISTVTMVLDEDEKFYNGSAVYPKPILTVGSGDKEYTLREDEYEVEYENNTDIGLATSDNAPAVIVKGAGNFTGTISKKFSILLELEKNDTAVIAFDKGSNDFEWTGSAIRPDVSVSRVYKGETTLLNPNTDYTLSFVDNVNVSSGSRNAIVKAVGKGLYRGELFLDFFIIRAPLEGGAKGSAVVTLESSVFPFTGTPHNPISTVTMGADRLRQNIDYKLEYVNSTNAGDESDEDGPYVKITGMGNYSGEVRKHYTILHTDINKISVRLENRNVNITSYDDLVSGKLLPKLIVTDRKNEQYARYDYVIDSECYTVEAKDDSNKTSGKAIAIVKGIGNYTGTKEIDFTIVGTEMSKISFAPIADQIVVLDSEGKNVAITPNVVALSKTGYVLPTEDPINGYDLYYANNNKLGTASAMVAGRGSYSGSKIINFKIVAKSLDSSDISVDITPEYTEYNGLDVKVLSDIYDNSVYGGESYSYKLVEGVDYRTSYTNNKKAGTAKVTFTGKGNYKGSITKTYIIDKAPIDDSKVSISVSDSAFNNGREVKPSITAMYRFDDGRSVKLAPSDYIVSYTNNISVSTNESPAFVTITGSGRGNFDKGTAGTSFRIKDKAYILNATNVLVSKLDSYEYNGKAIEPDITVTDRKSKVDLVQYNGANEDSADYRIDYVDNIEKGNGRIIIRGMNEYAGVMEVKFRILAKNIASKTGIPEGFSVVVNDNNPIYYSGYSLTPYVTVVDESRAADPDGGVLVAGKDYTLAYRNNTEPGRAGTCVQIKGKGSFTGNFDVPFTISPIIYDSDHIIIDTASLDYTGRAQSPKFNVYYSPSMGLDDDYILLNPAKAYKLTFANNTNAGSATVTALRTFGAAPAAAGSKYSVDSTFTIRKGNIENAIVAAIQPQSYTLRGIIEPKPTVKVNGAALKEGKDYTCSYSNNTRRGMGSLTITATPGSINFYGSKTVYFLIK